MTKKTAWRETRSASRVAPMAVSEHAKRPSTARSSTGSSASRPPRGVRAVRCSVGSGIGEVADMGLVGRLLLAAARVVLVLAEVEPAGEHLAHERGRAVRAEAAALE